MGCGGGSGGGGGREEAGYSTCDFGGRYSMSLSDRSMNGQIRHLEYPEIVGLLCMCRTKSRTDNLLGGHGAFLK